MCDMVQATTVAVLYGLATWYFAVLKKAKNPCWILAKESTLQDVQVDISCMYIY